VLSPPNSHGRKSLVVSVLVLALAATVAVAGVAIARVAIAGLVVGLARMLGHGLCDGDGLGLGGRGLRHSDSLVLVHGLGLGHWGLGDGDGLGDRGLVLVDRFGLGDGGLGHCQGLGLGDRRLGVVFRDSDGGRHGLGVSIAIAVVARGGEGQWCGEKRQEESEDLHFVG